jgi:hypothetical protein
VWKWVAIAIGTAILLMIAFVVGMYLAPVNVREATRDIFIIILGLFQLLTVVLLTVLLFAVLYAVNQINKVASGSVLPKIDEAMLKMNDVLDSTRTIAGSARDTVSNVSGSTTFVTERVVSPIIRLSSLFIGVRAAATSLARRDAPARMERELD